MTVLIMSLETIHNEIQKYYKPLLISMKAFHVDMGMTKEILLELIQFN